MEKIKLFDIVKKEIESLGWITAGYTEEGKLIQFNWKEQKYRVLDTWVEIRRIDNKSHSS